MKVATETQHESSRSSMFSDKHVFHEDYLPERILHRDGQIGKIKEILADVETGSRPDNILTTGAFGSGKTLVVKATCRTLPDGCVFIYLNCSKENTRLRIIRATLQQLGVATPETGFPGDYYERRFEQAIAQHKFVILALDEVDKFTERKDAESFEFFYMLSRLVSNVSVVLLTNRASFETDFANNMDARVRDTFRWIPIEFPDYDSNQLAAIVDDRCHVGLKDGSYDRGICALVAALAYNQAGRARGALALMRKAAEQAEAHGHSKIEENDVREGARQLKERQGQEVIRRLPPIERKILAHILINNPTGVAAYRWYGTIAPEHGAATGLTTFYEYLNRLETVGLIEKEKHGRGRAKGLDMILHVVPQIEDDVRLSLETELEPDTPLPSTVNVTGKPT
jgi:orc1/cdc6 family replication initiation protein